MDHDEARREGSDAKSTGTARDDGARALLQCFAIYFAQRPHGFELVVTDGAGHRCARRRAPA